MSKKVITTTVNEDLYKQARLLAVLKGINVNELIEEGLIYVLNKNKNEKEN